jgi:hypothetical protein
MPLDPGGTAKYERTFYVPQGQFDLLTLGIDAPYTKFEAVTVPSRLDVNSQGKANILTPPGVWQFKATPVTALDIR